ncbi:MAG: sensor histidine kinase [Thermoplasmatota archaeon]
MAGEPMAGQVEAKQWKRALITTAALGGYAALFWLFYPVTGPSVAALMVIPFILLGWNFGFFVGVASGLLAGPLSFVTFRFLAQRAFASAPAPGSPESWWFVVPVVLAMGIAGGGSGWMHDLLIRFETTNTQLDVERRRAEDFVRRFRIAADVSSDVVFDIDLDSKKQWANVHAEEIFGPSRVDAIPLITDEFAERVVPADRPLLDAAFRGIYDGRAEDVDLQLAVRRRDHDELATVRVRARLMRDESGRPRRVIGAATDLTPVMEAAQERVENERLVRVVDFKTNLLNQVAHEVNTPLTALRLQFANLKASKMANDPELLQKISKIDAGFTRLGAVVSDALETARIQSGKVALHRVEFDPSDLLHDTILLFEPLARERNVRVVESVDIECPVRALRGIRCMVGDQNRLTQVVANLLSNAIKYSPDGGEVRMRMMCGAGETRIEVIDQGRGLTPDQIARLFRPFSQVHGGANLNGTGLGLYISKSIIEQMGGRLWCESAGLGKGATFAFCVPCGAIPRAATHEGLAPAVHAAMT